MSMSLIQIGVVVLAVLVRWRSTGWYSIIAVIGTLGLLPVIVLSPLVVAGFLAPQAAWPLMVLADVLLITSALTLADGGDAGAMIPILDDKTADSTVGQAVDKVGRIAGIAYLMSIVPLLIWTWISVVG
ncbi:hypothetical protein APR12_005567 [Nocardia amikacinitolerans]|uniref:hypothetical protein n=1 Tax=Nocardia amikacinitolerans TaxID=756689 RepID=UPI00082D27CE|nr:hypothetical protein [Nocardia amikacinitolerans]MCP2320186.1 hypothetical protein [Nocardia amikacinitolerans]